jgi:ComF family protein
VHRLKYKGGKGLGYYLGQQLGYLIAASGWYDAMDYVVPVPLHRSKLRDRGFNQSEIIGRGLSSVIDVPVNCNILHKVASTQSQTRKKRFMRWQNVESVFGIAEGVSLEGARIILVDDVITTGSTLESCGEKLLERGARVWIATIGVTV